jgi:hypothetical protein
MYNLPIFLDVNGSIVRPGDRCYVAFYCDAFGITDDFNTPAPKGMTHAAYIEDVVMFEDHDRWVRGLG